MDVKTFLRQYGLTEKDIKPFKLFKSGRDLWIGTEECVEFDGVRVNKRGMRAARDLSKGIKPTTAFVQLFGDRIRKNVVYIEDGYVEEFINGGTVPCRGEVNTRFVVVKWRDYTIGVGLYRSGYVKSQIPRSRRNVG